MKNLLLILLVVFISSCSKEETCETCDVLITNNFVNIDYACDNGIPFSGVLTFESEETLEYCGDDLKAIKASAGTETLEEVCDGLFKERYTTVTCSK